MGLPLAKLRQVPPPVRAALKVRHITTCDQLLAAAARFEDRAALAHAARIDPDRLTDLVRQADLERVKGVGWAFGLMLEALGIGDVATLAQQQPGRLHGQLRRYNQTHKLARRAPTAEEVASWIEPSAPAARAGHLPAAAAGSEALAGTVGALSRMHAVRLLVYRLFT